MGRKYKSNKRNQMSGLRSCTKFDAGNGEKRINRGVENEVNRKHRYDTERKK